MSDLYIELRSRIPVVAQQTHLGRQRLQDAQDSVGLSNEAIARKVPVSEKTWRRWKERGEIPTSSLPAVAKALRLELRELSPEVASEGVDLRLAEIEARMESALNNQARVFETLERLTEAVDGLSDLVEGALEEARLAPRRKRRTA